MPSNQGKALIEKINDNHYKATWLSFHHREEWEAISKTGFLVGHIKWHTSGQEYILKTNGSVILSGECSQDISNFINHLNYQRGENAV